VAKAWEYLTSGYKQNVHEVLNEALFTEEYDENGGREGHRPVLPV